MPVMQFREALRAAMTEEMERDENVFLMGEEVAQYNGAYKVSEGMLDKFGPRRVIDTPISEAGFSGLGVGAAMVGLRPIIEFMSWSFTLVCIDQIVNNAANVRYMSGGQFKVPDRLPRRQRHRPPARRDAQPPHGVASTPASPGLIVVAPSTPADAKGLLKSRHPLRRPGHLPRVREDARTTTGEVPDDADFTLPIGVANVERAGQRRHDRQLRPPAPARRAAGGRGAGERPRHRRRADRPPHAPPARRRTRSSSRSRRPTAA